MQEAKGNPHLVTYHKCSGNAESGREKGHATIGKIEIEHIYVKIRSNQYISVDSQISEYWTAKAARCGR